MFNSKTDTDINILANTDKLIIILMLWLTMDKWQIIKFYNNSSKINKKWINKED